MVSVYRDCSGPIYENRVESCCQCGSTETGSTHAQTQAYQDDKDKSRQIKEDRKTEKERRGIRLKSNDLNLVLRLEISWVGSISANIWRALNFSLE